MHESKIVSDDREHPLSLEAVPATHKRPFINVQSFVSSFSKSSITLTSFSFFLEQAFPADFPWANHVFYTIPSFRSIAFALIFPLRRGFLLFSFTSQDAVTLWRQSRALHAFAAAFTRLRGLTIDAVGGRTDF
jgi:hypothetical protein